MLDSEVLVNCVSLLYTLEEGCYCLNKSKSNSNTNKANDRIVLKRIAQKMSFKDRPAKYAVL